MFLTFHEQFEILDPILGRFFAGNEQLTVFVGSGVSGGRMPMMAELIARAFTNLPLGAASEEHFLFYSERDRFSLRLTENGFPPASNPLDLGDFRELDALRRQYLCSRLCDNYGEVFQRLLPVYGGKRALLEAIGFIAFQTGEPDAAHYFIAALFLEDRLQHVVTTNWDRLIEAAVDALAGPSVQSPVTVIKDRESWLHRRERPPRQLVKVHGCSSQYPAFCDEIVLTDEEQDRTCTEDWKQQILRELLNGPVIFSGFSGNDYTLRIPLQWIGGLRDQNQLPQSRHYVSQDNDLETRARQLVNQDDSRHIRLKANDLFASIYFGWLRARLKEGIRYARGLPAYQRPFAWDWNNDEWTGIMARIESFVDNDLPNMLDSIIGPPEQREWNDDTSRLVVRIGHLRKLFLDGFISDKEKYARWSAEPTKDVKLLIIASALSDILHNRTHIVLELQHSYCGINVKNSETGTQMQVILYHGIDYRSAYPTLNVYLDELERTAAHLLAPEVVILPCTDYKQPEGDGLRPRPILERQLPGLGKVRRIPIHPNRILNATSYADLRDRIESVLKL